MTRSSDFDSIQVSIDGPFCRETSRRFFSSSVGSQEHTQNYCGATFLKIVLVPASGLLLTDNHSSSREPPNLNLCRLSLLLATNSLKSMMKAKPSSKTVATKTKSSSKDEVAVKSQSEVRSKKILDTLKEHYKLGCKAKKFCAASKSHGALTNFARSEGLVQRTARMRLAFARQYNQSDFDAFCKLRRVIKPKAKGSNEEAIVLPLLSAHVTYLLTIEAAVETWNEDYPKKKRDALEERRKFARLAAEKNLTPKQLHDAIRLSFGRHKVETHGRTHIVPTNLETAIEVFIDESEQWLKRGELLVIKLQDKPKLKRRMVQPLNDALVEGQKLNKKILMLITNTKA
jgi:hypothetical protein